MVPPRQRTLILGLILLGFMIAGFFGLRALHAFREFRRHGPPPLEVVFTEQAPETDVELIRDWMTIPYISKTYRVPARALFEALGISPRGNEDKSLAQLNEEFFPQSPQIVIELVKAVIRAERAVPTGLPPFPTVPPPLTAVPPMVP